MGFAWAKNGMQRLALRAAADAALGLKAEKGTMRITLAAFLILILSACATTTLERRDYKSYSIGQVLSANVGGTFLVDQTGSVEKVKTWVGLLYSPDGWKVEERYSEDYIRKELIYSGISGSTIEISYREFRGGFAALAFFQSVKYDVSDSPVITFQNFQIEVLSADNQGISCRLIRD